MQPIKFVLVGREAAYGVALPLSPAPGKGLAASVIGHFALSLSLFSAISWIGLWLLPGKNKNPEPLFSYAPRFIISYFLSIFFPYIIVSLATAGNTISPVSMTHHRWLWPLISGNVIYLIFLLTCLLPNYL